MTGLLIFSADLDGFQLPNANIGHISSRTEVRKDFGFMKNDEEWWTMMKNDEEWWRMMKNDEEWSSHGGLGQNRGHPLGSSEIKTVWLGKEHYWGLPWRGLSHDTLIMFHDISSISPLKMRGTPGLVLSYPYLNDLHPVPQWGQNWTAQFLEMNTIWSLQVSKDINQLYMYSKYVCVLVSMYNISPD